MSEREGPATPLLVVVCGLPGVGKSTVSRGIAERLDGSVLRTDVVRKGMVDDPAYTAGETAAVYDELLAQARERLENGDVVVLDGTFKSRERRLEARELAGAVGARFRLVRVECDESVVARRIAERDGVSDADLEVHRRLRERFDPLEMDHLTVDNSGTEAATHERIEAAF